MTEQVLSGRYRMSGHLARGGMADVFEAQDTLLNRPVAIKILHANFASDEAFVTRFRREAQAAANLSHPNIVSIYDWGKHGDTYYMVMELIEGRTLREIVKTTGPLLPRRAAEIAAEAASALTVAHQAGVFHRDVKPGNIMVTADGGVKVTDFGIARALDDSEELTRTGAVIGTATYFSPEQAQGLPADGRSDVYSLGVVLYEMVCGRPPFSGESPVAVAYQHVSEYAVPADQVNPEVPRELAAIVEKAMAKDPVDRYQSADEIRSDLLLYLSGRVPVAAGAAAAAAATALISTPPPTASPDETARAVASQPTDEEDRSQLAYVAAVVGLVVVLAVGVFILIQLLSGGATAAEKVTVPDLTLQPFEQAFESLQQLDLKVRSRNESSSTVPAGLVIGTEPEAGEEVDAESFILVVVSTGVEQFVVPGVVDETEQVARSLIEAQGFEVAPIDYVLTEGTQEGIVISQSPEGGTSEVPGTAVRLTVSLGPFSLTVPDVAGLSADSALLQLTRDGFSNVLTTEEFSADVLSGFTIRTEPLPGQVVPRDATITVFVSQGPEPVGVPALIGLTEDQAESALNALGLLLVFDPTPVEVALDSGLIGMVAEQSPPAAEVVEVGSDVTVRLGILRRVVVPNFSGLTVEQAQSAATAAGVRIDIAATVEDAANVGLIVSQTPPAGESVDEGTIIGLTVGIEPATTTTTTTTSTTSTTAP